MNLYKFDSGAYDSYEEDWYSHAGVMTKAEVMALLKAHWPAVKAANADSYSAGTELLTACGFVLVEPLASIDLGSSNHISDIEKALESEWNNKP